MHVVLRAAAKLCAYQAALRPYGATAVPPLGDISVLARRSSSLPRTDAPAAYQDRLRDLAASARTPDDVNSALSAVRYAPPHFPPVDGLHLVLRTLDARDDLKHRIALLSTLFYSAQLNGYIRVGGFGARVCAALLRAKCEQKTPPSESSVMRMLKRLHLQGGGVTSEMREVVVQAHRSAGIRVSDSLAKMLGIDLGQDEDPP